MLALAESINVRILFVDSVDDSARDPARCDWGPNGSTFLTWWRLVATCLPYVVNVVLNPFATAEGEWIKGDQQGELFEALVL